MPISWSEWNKVLNVKTIREAFDREDARRAALTPEQRAEEQRLREMQDKRVREHIAFLDYCVSKKIDPNLVLPVKPR